MMIRSLAISLAEKDIRVNGIGPGILETPLTKDGLEKGNNKQVLKSQIPLGRIGLPKDIGGAAVFLSSEEAEYITGKMLYICLLYTSPSPRDRTRSRMPSSA